MGYSDDLRASGAHIWDKEKQHPFIAELGQGTLPVEKFAYYMRQDYLFLVEYCRVIALAVAKAPGIEDMAWFSRLLHETIGTEMSLHAASCVDLGISEEALRATRPSPATLAYTSHLVSVAYGGTAGQVAAALLPCSWGYAEIGRMLADQGTPIGPPMYARWIEMYSSPEFDALARWLRAFVDREAGGCGPAERDAMEAAFLTSSRHEYLFWDAAYRLEGWPV